MIFYTVLAFLNGSLVSTCRVLNGRLSQKTGPFMASLWNHAVGFLLLTVLLAVSGGWMFDKASGAPLTGYLGGFFGALFVVVNSFVFQRLGAMNTTLLAISGQMISAVFLDYWIRGINPGWIQIFGVFLIIFGMYQTRYAMERKKKASHE